MGVLAALAAIAGLVLWRRSARRRARIDLYFADGSMVTFEQDSVEANRLLPIAREIVDTVRVTA